MRPGQLPHKHRPRNVRYDPHLYRFLTTRTVRAGVVIESKSLNVIAEYSAEALIKKYSLEGTFLSHYQTPPACLDGYLGTVGKSRAQAIFSDIVHDCDFERTEFLYEKCLPAKRDDLLTSQYEELYEEISRSREWKIFSFYYTVTINSRSVRELHHLTDVPDDVRPREFDPQNIANSHWPMY